MKLENFSIPNGRDAIEIRALGVLWDLHNIAAFEGFQHDLYEDRLELKWRIDPEYARGKYPSSSLAILFRNVNFLKITPRDGELLKTEDTCLSSVSLVSPCGELKPYSEAINESEFHLMFKFRSNITIRVGAKSAEFIPRKTT